MTSAILTILVLGRALRAPFEDEVETSLVSSVRAAKAGTTFDIVYLLEPIDGWHVYWSNPGDSGMAPTVKWNAPVGVKIEGPDFPVPQLIKDEAGTTFVFEHKLPLVYHVTVPANFTEKELKLTLGADWLVCKSQCLQGKGTGFLSVSIADNAIPAPEAPVIAAAVQSVPPVAAEGSVDVKKTKDGVDIIWKSSRTELQKPAFWSSDENAFDNNSAQSWTFSAGNWVGHVKFGDPSNPPKQCRGLLVDTDAKGQAVPKSAVRISVPFVEILSKG